MQIRRSMPFSFAKSVDPPTFFFFKSETATASRKVNANAFITSNFAQLVKKATCLMTITHYNSNNSFTPEFKWALLEKRNNLNELINVPTKAEEISMIQISFWTGPRSEHQERHNPESEPQIQTKIHTTVFKLRESSRFTAKIHMYNPCAF